MTDTDIAIRDEKGRFEKGPGRQVGSYNKYTRVIKEALLIAAELEGSNGNGAGKLIGFLRSVAKEDKRAFCMMLSRAMPLQIENRTIEPKQQVVYRSLEEVNRELESRGISMEVMVKLMRDEPLPMGTDIDQVVDG